MAPRGPTKTKINRVVGPAISIQSHQRCVFFSRKKKTKQLEREVSIRNTPFNDDFKTDTPLFTETLSLE